MMQRESPGDHQRDPRLAFGRRLRWLRKRAGLSQEALADLAGIDRTYVSGTERGRRNISLKNICRLAAALNTQPASLLKGVSSQHEAGDER